MYSMTGYTYYIPKIKYLLRLATMNFMKDEVTLGIVFSCLCVSAQCVILLDHFSESVWRVLTNQIGDARIMSIFQ